MIWNSDVKARKLRERQRQRKLSVDALHEGWAVGRSTRALAMSKQDGGAGSAVGGRGGNVSVSGPTGNSVRPGGVQTGGIPTNPDGSVKWNKKVSSMTPGEQEVQNAHQELMHHRENRHKEKMKRYADARGRETRAHVRRLALYLFLLGLGVTGAVVSCQLAVLTDPCAACLNGMPACEDGLWDGDETPGCMDLRRDVQTQCVQLCSEEPSSEDDDFIPEFEPEPGYPTESETTP